MLTKHFIEEQTLQVPLVNKGQPILRYSDTRSGPPFERVVHLLRI